MNENENLVAEATEKVEQIATEQTPKTYTQDELNEIVGKRLARQEARLNKEYERKQRENEDLIETLKTGTGKQTVSELIDTFTDFYTGKGIKINKQPDYSAKDIETLARADASDIINGGYEDVVEEVDRLANIDNLSPRDKALFKILAEHRQKLDRSKELAKIGISADVYNSKSFNEFQSMFKEDTPITMVYEQYQKTQQKKEIKPAGSIKNTAPADNGIKDFYTIEEARQFTEADFKKNPKIYERVVESSYKWNKK